jgi:hypothetical protein
MLLIPWLQDILAVLENGELDKEEYDLSCWRLVLLGKQYIPHLLFCGGKRSFLKCSTRLIMGSLTLQDLDVFI